MYFLSRNIMESLMTIIIILPTMGLFLDSPMSLFNMEIGRFSRKMSSLDPGSSFWILAKDNGKDQLGAIGENFDWRSLGESKYEIAN